MTAYMAECFWPGVTEHQLADAGTRARREADAIDSSSAPVRYTGSILVPADEIALCFFEAASIDAVTDLNRRAAIPFERILQIVRLGPRGAQHGSAAGVDDHTTSAKELR